MPERGELAGRGGPAALMPVTSYDPSYSKPANAGFTGQSAVVTNPHSSPPASPPLR